MTNKHLLKEKVEDEHASIIIRKIAIFSFFENINRTVKYTALFALTGIVFGGIAIAAVFFTGGLAALGIFYAVAIALGAGLLGASLGFGVAKVSEPEPLTYEGMFEGEIIIQCEEVPENPSYLSLYTPLVKDDVDKPDADNSADPRISL